MDKKQEKVIIENIIKLLRRAKFSEITGDEALVIHQSLDYLIRRMKALDAPPVVIQQEAPKEEKPKKKPVKQQME
jgi:hypothetical protein